MLSLLAGLLVLEASGSREGPSGHPMLTAARASFERAADAIRHARPTSQSNRHHRALLAAVSQLDAALDAATTHQPPSRARTRDDLLALIRDAYGHLQVAGSELPGFDLVALDQGCCGTGSQNPTTSSSR